MPRARGARRATLCDELGVGLYGVWAIQALGDLELGLGNVAAAAEHHEAQVEALQPRGIADVDLSPAPELVDAYLRLGRDGRRRAAPRRVRRARRGEGPAVGAGARRALPRAAGRGRRDGARGSTQALALHDAHARRRSRRRARGWPTARACGARASGSARARSCGAALETFERLGARSWADQADAELAATGETARRRDASTVDDLTPQELQIARLLAEGRTTREAAAAIFVSPKTVEYHLRHVYDKLGIRSRDELAAALGAR